MVATRRTRSGTSPVPESGAGGTRAPLRRGPAHPGGHVGSGERDRQGQGAGACVRREGPMSRPRVYRATAQRVDALPSRALEPDDADAHRVHGEGRPHADDSAQCARGRRAGRSRSRGRDRTVLHVQRPPRVRPGRCAAGDSRIRPYDLRHSYGTALYSVAGDTRLVKEVLGHSDTRMTERYTLGHVPEAMRLATSRFEEHLGAPDAPSAARKQAAGGAGS